MKTVARILGLLSLGIGALVLRPVNTYQGFMVKTTATAMTPMLTAIGVIAAALGLGKKSRLAMISGAAGAGIGAAYIRRTTAGHDAFDRAFVPDWRSEISPETERRMMQRRLAFRLPATPEPRWTRDVPFWTIPGSDRRLLADIWQPAEGVTPSGTAIVYLYGGSWHFFDKDVLTRPLFRQLTAQGHVVMDAGHRSCPETDITGMVADVHRAVAWIKANADRYGIDPARVVTMGGSSGAHIALLAAYAPEEPRFVPEELIGVDTSVMAVVSWYGIPEMLPVYERTKQQSERMPEALSATKRPEPGKIEQAINQLILGRPLAASQLPPAPPFPQIYANVMGGQPDEVPEMYELASPLTHVGPTCPPTLIFQGAHDVVVPLDSARRLPQALEAAGVPTVYIEYPWTEHAFDLMFPPLANPAAKAALYDLERFLAIVAARSERSGHTRFPIDGGQPQATAAAA